jgi:hypothetical protein
MLRSGKDIQVVLLEPPHRRVMMKKNEDVLYEVNIFNILGFVYFRSYVRCSPALPMQLGHLGNTPTIVLFVFQWCSWWLRGGNPPPLHKHCYLQASNVLRFELGLHRGVLAAMSKWNGYDGIQSRLLQSVTV